MSGPLPEVVVVQSIVRKRARTTSVVATLASFHFSKTTVASDYKQHTNRNDHQISTMYTILAIVSAHAREEAVQRRRQLFSIGQRRMLHVCSRSPLGNQRITFRQESHRPSGVSFPRLHTTTKSLAPPSAVTLQDNDDGITFDDHMEQEIEMLTSSCLSQFLPPSSLPEEIFYRQGEEAMNFDTATLDGELGIDSLWDVSAPEELDEIVEEDYDSILPLETGFNHIPDRSGPSETTPMEILRDFNFDMRPCGDNKEELQLWLECAAQREAVMKYQELVEKARDRKAFDSMSLMQRHVVQWYQDLRDAIESRQKEYLSNEDTRRARKRYGPFLCSLHPEKMAVITSHETITQALLLSGRNGKEGVPLVKFAQLVGAAVETEVVSQRRMKERFTSFAHRDEDEEDDEEAGNDPANERTSSSEATKVTAIDHWKFSASHLKMYMDELKRIDPKLGKSKRAINYAMRRAKQAMNVEEKWSQDDLTHIGSALLSIIIENAKIHQNGKEEPAFRVEKRWSKGSKSTSYIVLHDYLLKLFLEDEFLSWAANTTRHKPMIVPPSDWMGPHKGGYRWLKVDLMRTHRSNMQKEALEHGDLSLVADGLNILGKTPWKINKRILKAGEYCWESNIPIGDIPSSTDIVLPPEPTRPERLDPEVFEERESPEALAAVEAIRVYRERMYKRQRLHQKNMVSQRKMPSFSVLVILLLTNGIFHRTSDRSDALPH